MKSFGLELLFVSLLVATQVSVAAEKPQIKDQVSFQIEVGREVDNDHVVALLSTTSEDRDPAKVAQQINKTMTWALAQIGKHQNVKPHSGSYQTHPVYDDKKIVRWRGRQELRLKSGDVEGLSQLTGQLQERLQVQSLQFSVSPEKRSDAESSLIEEALADFQQRAKLVSRSLNAGDFQLMDVTIHTGSSHQPVPLHMEARASIKGMAVAPPAIEQGTTRISVRVSGRIHLLRDR